MNVEIGTEAPIFLFWEYLFQIFGILSLQCRAAKAEQKSFILARGANEPTKEGPFSYVLNESPFASVSRGHPSPVITFIDKEKLIFLFSEVELGEMMVYADMVEAVDPSLVATYTKTK
jgi:hypothetical protein